MRKMMFTIALVAPLILAGASRAATIASPLVGVWKVASLALVTPSQPDIHPLGEHPSGYAIFTRGGHVAVFFVADNRPLPAAGTATETEAAKLYATLNGYAGTYRSEGKGKFLVHIEEAWLPAWKGTDQHRQFKLSGRRLTILSPTKSPVTGQDVTLTMTLERAE